MKRIVLLCLLNIGLSGESWMQTRPIEVLAATRPAIFHVDDQVTQNIKFLQWADGLDIRGINVLEKATTFFHDYGVALGVKNPSNAFLLEQTQIDKAGNTHLKFQQFYQGIPFFGGQFQLHFNNRGQLKTLNGVVFSDPTTATEPQLSYFDAISSAIRFMAKTFPDEDLNTISVQETALQLYHQGLPTQQSGELKLTYALTLSNQKNIREHIFVDARNGQVIAHFPAACSLLSRQLFFQNQNNPLWSEGELLPGNLDDWQQIQLQATAETYHFFSNTFQYSSFDGLDAEMLLIDQVSFLDCPNASWNGVSANFCEAISSDDVVAHEWGHAYTEYTSQLIYAWQAGAINEAYSDIWGETIDLLNGDENQDELRTGCEENNRWKIAEDATAIGTIRDMWQPSCYNHPGKISDTTYYCQSENFGGVHINSGIVNHAYALLVDGGQYNGFDINGIGLTKAAHIFWHAQRYYLTRTTDFFALADALEAACLDLRDVNLDRLSITNTDSGPSGQYLNTFDSLQLSQVLLAVEMRLLGNPCDNFSSALVTPAPVLCLQSGEAFNPFFIETFEEGAAAWTMEQIPGLDSTWNERNWMLSDNLPHQRIGKAMYAPTPNVGNCDADLDHGLLRLQSPIIIVPDDIYSDIFLTFNHYFSFEKGKDGGNLKVQRNGNNWMGIPPSAFLHNGYKQSITGQNNPLLHQKAYTGANQGSVAGSWGTTQINLAILGVQAGDRLVIRWEVGTDGCDGWDGWYVDDILLASCFTATVLPVSYLYFNARQQANGILLEWETAAEFNNKGFNIERSFDGRNFNTIGWMLANDTGFYQFTDKQPGDKQYIYYRLRQEDYDGNTSLSKIEVVKQTSTSLWRIYPNPARESVTIELANVTIFPLNIRIQSLDGRLLKNFIFQDRNDRLSVPLNNLTPGLYLLQMQTGEDVFYKHLVID